MDWKRLGKALLFPPVAVMLLLLPVSAFFLIGSMVFIGVKTVVACISYALAAYTVTVWCFRLPYLIKWWKAFQAENRYIKKWREDARLRVNVSLYRSLAWNALYGLFQLWLGLCHHTFWYCALGAYYICLGVMRFFLVSHTRRYRPGENMRSELVKYRACGWVFLVMNLALALIVFFMLYWNRTFVHHMITTIAMAAYTFIAFTVAIVNVVKYKKYNSPVFSAAKITSFAAACVSMLTLTSTMLTTFSDGTMGVFAQKMLLGGVGFAVSFTVITLAVLMLVQGSKKLKQIKTEVQHGT